MEQTTRQLLEIHRDNLTQRLELEVRERDEILSALVDNAAAIAAYRAQLGDVLIDLASDSCPAYAANL